MSKDIFKGIGWGLLLLVTLIMGGMSLTMMYLNTAERISSSSLAASQRLEGKLGEELYYLNRYISESSRDPRWSAYEDRIVINSSDTIKKTVDDCKECEHLYFYSILNTSDISELKEYLSRNADSERVSEYNTIRAVGLFCAFVTTLMSAYLIAALSKYKTLRFSGLAILTILAAPVCVILFDLTTMHPNYKYWTFEIAGDGLPIVFSILAMFVLYPPAIITARKAGINLLDLLKLKRADS